MQAASQAGASGTDGPTTAMVMRSVYMDCLPPCAGRTVKHFIACVAHGRLVGLISNEDVKSMLYAAQVAIQAAKLGSRSKDHAR